jgi:hypothetical protein
MAEVEGWTLLASFIANPIRNHAAHVVDAAGHLHDRPRHGLAARHAWRPVVSASATGLISEWLYGAAVPFAGPGDKTLQSLVDTVAVFEQPDAPGQIADFLSQDWIAGQGLLRHVGSFWMR